MWVYGVLRTKTVNEEAELEPNKNRSELIS